MAGSGSRPAANRVRTVHLIYPKTGLKREFRRWLVVANFPVPVAGDRCCCRGPARFPPVPSDTDAPSPCQSRADRFEWTGLVGLIKVSGAHSDQPYWVKSNRRDKLTLCDLRKRPAIPSFLVDMKSSRNVGSEINRLRALAASFKTSIAPLRAEGAARSTSKKLRARTRRTGLCSPKSSMPKASWC